MIFVLLAALAAPPAVDFLKDVRPILQAKCVACHGAAKQKGGLRLDIKAAALKGGDFHAPAIVPGDAAQSPLVQFVSGGGELTMPPSGARLSPDEVAAPAALDRRRRRGARPCSRSSGRWPNAGPRRWISSGDAAAGDWPSGGGSA